MTYRPMKGTEYKVRMLKLTDDEARKQFEAWLRTTGRDRLIDWTSIAVDQSEDNATTVTALTE